MQKLFIVIGLLLLIIGIAWPWLKKLGLGHLPGDILIKHDNFTFYFPLTSCVLLSIVISLLYWMLRSS